MEVLRTLHDAEYVTESPICLVDWTNEEGARFPGAMMSSGVWSGYSSASLSDCYALVDSKGITMKEALQDCGYLGSTQCTYETNPLQAYFEAHIEQGPLLENSGKKVGIVTSVQSMKWHHIRVKGVEGHSGTTPMEGRADALVTASRLIAAVSDIAKETKLGVATVGVIHNDTQSQATIPSGVDFIIDVRCSTDAMVDDLYAAIFARWDEIMNAGQCRTSREILRVWALQESKFHTDCIDAVRASAKDSIGLMIEESKGKEDMLMMDMKSGAGHDSAWTSRVCPTSMIFVPSKDGISHNPDEYTSPEDCALAAQVLLGAVLWYDKMNSLGSLETANNKDVSI